MESLFEVQECYPAVCDNLSPCDLKYSPLDTVQDCRCERFRFTVHFFPQLKLRRHESQFQIYEWKYYLVTPAHPSQAVGGASWFRKFTNSGFLVAFDSLHHLLKDHCAPFVRDKSKLKLGSQKRFPPSNFVSGLCGQHNFKISYRFCHELNNCCLGTLLVEELFFKSANMQSQVEL